jgi:hypothetical protein
VRRLRIGIIFWENSGRVRAERASRARRCCETEEYLRLKLRTRNLLSVPMMVIAIAAMPAA